MNDTLQMQRLKTNGITQLKIKIIVKGQLQ